MASSQNVEMEAAKFLHKLIQESKDEPAKLATKLYVILQHMKSSGKEHSMPYQVISRAMETVINLHALDIEALKLSPLPLTGGYQIGDSASAQFPGSSQAGGVAKDSKVGLAESEVSKVDPYASNRPPVGQSSSGHDYYQGSVAHRSSQSFDHESPSSLDSRSANSQSQERQQRDGKKATTKRKRGDTSLPVEQHDNTQQLDTQNAVVNPRKGKMNKVEPLASLSVKGGERTNFNMVPSSGQMEHFASLSGSMRSALRTKQEGQHMIEKQLDSANISNSMLWAPSPKYPEEVEVSSASGQQQGGSLPFHEASSNVVTGYTMAEILAQQSTAPSFGSSAFGKVQGVMAIASSSYLVVESGFSIPMRSNGALEHEGGSSNMLVAANKVVQSGRQSNVSEMSMLRNAAPRDAGKAPIPQAPTASGMPFKEQQLKQLRAQWLVFLAVRNGLLPKKLHLGIALGNIFPKEGGNTDGPRKELSDHKGKVQSSNDSRSSPDVMMPFVRPNAVRETDIFPPVASSTTRLMEAGTFRREAESLKMTEDKNGLTSDISVLAEEKKHLLAARKPKAETQTQEIAASQACLTMVLQQPGSLNTRGALAVSNPVEDVENGHLQVGRVNQGSSVMGRNKQMNPEIISWTGIGGHSEVSRGPILASSLQHELVPERKDSNRSHFQNLSNSSGPGNHYADSQSSSFTLKEQWKTISGVDNDHHTAIPMKDANVMSKRVSQEQEEEDRSVSTDSPPPPKYPMLEKWRKKKFRVEQSWIQKQQETNQRIATCFDKPKKRYSARCLIETTPEAQPSRPIHETQDPSPPSQSEFIQVSLIDRIRTPSDTCNAFSEFHDELDTTVLQHENEMAQAPNTSVLGSQQVYTIDTNGNFHIRYVGNPNALLTIPMEEKVFLEFNAMWQPVGTSGMKFRRLGAKYVRSGKFVGLSSKNWRKVDPQLKEDLWTTLMKKFYIKPNYPIDEIKRIELMNFGRRLKNYKYRVKKGLKIQDGDTHESIRDRLRNRGMSNAKEIETTSDTWRTAKYKELVERNKQCQRNHKIIHTSGSKSYARVAKELEISKQMPPTRAEVFVATHTKRDGTASTQEASKIINKLKKLMAEDIARENPVSPQGSILWAEDDALARAMGKAEYPGRVRGMGLGPLPVSRNISKKHKGVPKHTGSIQKGNQKMKKKEKRKKNTCKTQEQKETQVPQQDIYVNYQNKLQETFVHLTEEEEAEVERAFESDGWKVLVTHENSNIEITGKKLQCLRPCAFLNDEVINVYLELLKERENREPQKFLKCHFFNPFFHKKLMPEKNPYDYKSVKRWTGQRKLGYSLIDCDKIFIPIHRHDHWLLAVINNKDKKFQVLNSLGPNSLMDPQVLKVLARYFVDEVKDKSGKDINVSSWKQEFVEDLPKQENGFDCGMFMIKYADFYSRDLDLCFNQGHMSYFRQRTAKEILRLRAN